MVFSKAFRRAMFPDFAAEGAYINYKTVKGSLKALNDEDDATTPDAFFDVLGRELQKVYEWCKKRIELIKFAGERLMEQAQKEVPSTSLGEAADVIMFETLRLQEVRNLNQDLVDRLMRRHRRMSVLPMADQWDRLMAEHNFVDLPIDEIWYCLSNVYSVTRGDRQGGKAGQMATGDTGSQSFDRRSVKYWVHKQDIPFVIGRIVKHLPISVMRDVYQECKDRGVPYEIGGRISSVYYDNNKFLCYHRRLERLEGSTLFRIRWYTDFAEPDINHVADDSDVYIEMKVHHETWSGLGSSKRRFPMKSKDVDAYLAGRLPLSSYVERLQAKKTPPKDVEKFKLLATEILAKVQAFQLRPVLRTQYTRAAFQRGTDQTIRVSIDTNLLMTTEDFGASKHWRNIGQAKMSATRFPFAVVEVKLQCLSNERVPAWVEELMSCRFMEGVPKFSKYGHGIATLFGHSHRIHMLPYWGHQLATEIRAATKLEHQDWDPMQGLTVGCFEKLKDRIAFGGDSAAAHASRLPPVQYEFLEHPTAKQLGQLAMLSSVDIEPSVLAQMEESQLHGRQCAYIEMNVWDTDASREVGCLDAILRDDAHPDAAASYNGLIPWQTAKRIRVPQKFDPKTFVSSERYFVKWVEHGVHLALAGLFAIHYGTGGHTNLSTAAFLTTSRNLWLDLGVTMVAAAIALLLYSLFVLHARSLRIYARKKQRYDDISGVTTLTALMLVTVATMGASLLVERFGYMWLDTRDPSLTITMHR